MIDCDPTELTLDEARKFAAAHAPAGTTIDLFSTESDLVNFRDLANEAYDMVDIDALSDLGVSWQTLAEWAEDQAGAQR